MTHHHTAAWTRAQDHIPRAGEGGYRGQGRWGNGFGAEGGSFAYDAVMDDRGSTTRRHDEQVDRIANGIVWGLGLALGLPLLLFGCLVAVVLGPWLGNDVVNSGSATGEGAIQRAEKILGNVGGGRWRSAASNARAKWTAPDSHGDNSEYFAFDLPVHEIAGFEEAIRAEWSKANHFRGPDQVKSMSGGDNAPRWIHEPLEGGVFYQQGTKTIGISRETGRVVLSRREW